MDPNRPRMPKELATEASGQPAEPPVAEKQSESPSEPSTGPLDHEHHTTDDEVVHGSATSGTLDLEELSSSIDAGAPAPPRAVPDKKAESEAAGLVMDAALSPPSIDEIADSLTDAPASTADSPPANLASDVVSPVWDGVPEAFAPHDDVLAADPGASISDDVPGNNPPAARDGFEINDFLAPDTVEPQSSASDDFRALDRPLGADPSQYVTVNDLPRRPNEPVVIERGPVRADSDSWRSSVTLLGETSREMEVPDGPSGADLSPRATRLQSPTSDGGPPLARPIFLVSVPDEQTRRILDEALVEAGRRDAKTLAEIAEQKVHDAFWLRACEERAVYGGR